MTRLPKSKPAAFFEPSLAALITPGNFDEDLPKIAECDWVVEAVAENLEIKTALLTRVVAASRRRTRILTTNTSGLPIARIAAAVPGHWQEIFRDALLQSAALHAPA